MARCALLQGRAQDSTLPESGRRAVLRRRLLRRRLQAGVRVESLPLTCPVTLDKSFHREVPQVPTTSAAEKGEWALSLDRKQEANLGRRRCGEKTLVPQEPQCVLVPQIPALGDQEHWQEQSLLPTKNRTGLPWERRLQPDTPGDTGPAPVHGGARPPPAWQS